MQGQIEENRAGGREGDSEGERGIKFLLAGAGQGHPPRVRHRIVLFVLWFAVKERPWAPQKGCAPGRIAGGCSHGPVRTYCTSCSDARACIRIQRSTRPAIEWPRFGIYPESAGQEQSETDVDDPFDFSVRQWSCERGGQRREIWGVA